MTRYSIVLVFILLLLSACSSKSPHDQIADLVNLKQDASRYHGLDPYQPLLTPESQKTAYTHFMTEHFAPWDRTEPKHTPEQVFWGLDVYAKKEIYGENTLRRDPAWLLKMHEASRVADYPSISRRAITVTNANMRVLPTNQPVFFDFSKAGEGFPFDYMQNSLVLAGTPLYASHLSADGAWVMVETRFTYGWVHVRDIGWVDESFISQFKTGTYAAITQDDIPITGIDGTPLITGHVGTILPIMEGKAGENGFAANIPVRGAQGEALLQTAFLPKSYAQIAPLLATPANFALLTNAMMGRLYGWGGLYEDRDCSAATMDLMAAFGIYLPRNSSQQIKVGTHAPLENMDVDEKRAFITANATPFLTLVRKPGHIMLYIGTENGEPLVFHAIWGLKTEVNNEYGRKIIGKAVITSLEPGIELTDLARPEGVILETVYAISTLPGLIPGE